MKKVALINPPLVADPGDITGTGTPYMPISLASINAVIKEHYEVSVYDMYGAAPTNKFEFERNVVYGLDLEHVYHMAKDADTVILYHSFAICHDFIVAMLRILRQSSANIIVVENSQHVTAFPLDFVKEELFKAGADFIICGDPEEAIIDAIEGRGENFGRYFIKVSDIPTPCWDGFPLENYWALPYAHAPKTSEKYMAISSSRGCPGVCNFCTNPYLNKSIWRGRSAYDVYNEIRYWYNKGIKEFHFEDLNMSVGRARMILLCRLISKDKMGLKLKIASGLKIETIDAEVLVYMHDAGFDYLSFSPESGSTELLDGMNKRFDHDHAVRILRLLNNGPLKGSMITQACFILGYRNERGYYRDLTRRYIIQLAKEGLDEVAIFNWVPIPGSAAKGDINVPLSKISFSSEWRPYNRKLSKIRMKYVIEFFMAKLRCCPLSFFRLPKTKIFMTIRRILYTKFRRVR